MKRIYKLVSFILIILMLGISLLGCNGDSDSYSYYDDYSDYSDNTGIKYSSQAIQAVKNDNLEQRIANALGFKKFYSPEYGTSSAEKNYDGSWDVTIKGNMSGYVDDYHDDFESYKFLVDATVYESGSVTIYVKKV